MENMDARIRRKRSVNVQSKKFMILIFSSLGWGMTELAPAGIIAEVDGAHPGSCGKICMNSEAKVVDVNTGKLLGPNERGELAIRGPQVRYI